ncbi:MAG: hypothetical protein RLY93_05065 [Sumerlaeia bacterium]
MLGTRSPFAGAYDPAMLAAGAIRVVAARGESWGLMGGGPVGMTVRAGVAGPMANYMVEFQAVNAEAYRAPQRNAERELNLAVALGEGGGEVTTAAYFGGFIHAEDLRQIEEQLRGQVWEQSEWEQRAGVAAASLGYATLLFPPAGVVTVPAMAAIGVVMAAANAGDAIGYLTEGELGAAGAETFQAALWSLEVLPGIGAVKTAGRAGVASVRASARTGAAEGAALVRAMAQGFGRGFERGLQRSHGLAFSDPFGLSGLGAVGEGVDEALRAGRGFNAAKRVARPADSPIYSVAYEVELERGVHFPGRSDAIHFQEANKQLYEVMNGDARFAHMMENLYPGITEGVSPGARGAFPRTPPTPDVTWHHHTTREGVLQLVPRSQHSAPGAVQKTLHPDGRGGMEVWGGGRKGRMR